MKLHEMELLVRVAETGSMTRAAKQLHLTTAAVSATVQRIEEALGLRIFERTTRSLHPTGEGLVLLEGCQDVLGRWQRALEDAQDHRTGLEGTVHLAAPADTTYQLLSAVVADLRADHPGLQVILHIGDSIQHLHQDAIDMAVRYGPLQDSTLSARKLVQCPAILVASPDYLQTHGAPQTVQELAAHTCVTLQLANTPNVVWTLYKDFQAHTAKLERPLCGDGYLARRWAIEGVGVAFKSLFDVIDDLEEGRLVQVLPDYTSEQIAIHAIFPSHRFLPARVRVLDEAITERFRARAKRCQKWLDGR